MEALAIYLTFNYFVSTILGQWGPVFGVDYSVEAGSGTGLATIASIKTLDMGIMGALIISGIATMLHNKFFDTELPEWLGVFSGSVFIYMIGFFVMVPVALIACLVWPHVQAAISAFQGFILSAGTFGVGVFAFFERVLIPTGLHHFIYTPFYYDNAAVNGGIFAAWANILPQLAADPSIALKDAAPWAAYTCPGWTKVFGSLGVAIAFYMTAKPERKQRVKALLIPVTLTAMLCGITEPLDFTFLFIAPGLFVVHCVPGALGCMAQNLLGVVGIFDGGIISMLSWDWLPLWAAHGLQYAISILVGLCFTALWVVVFRFLIVKFDFKTPGREDDDVEVELKSKADYKQKQGGAAGKSAAQSKDDERLVLAENILDLLGGTDNIIDVTNCATRLRVNVKDKSVVAPEASFKAIGTHGLVVQGQSIQVIIGLSVPQVREKFESLLKFETLL